MGFNCLKARANFEEAVYFLPLKSWKAESTLEPPIGFEHGTPGLGIQRLNH